jgi:hypothetical protein
MFPPIKFDETIQVLNHLNELDSYEEQLAALKIFKGLSQIFEKEKLENFFEQVNFLFDQNDGDVLEHLEEIKADPETIQELKKLHRNQ